MPGRLGQRAALRAPCRVLRGLAGLPAILGCRRALVTFGVTPIGLLGLPFWGLRGAI
ncbi:MAG: hypothetical protein AB7K24_01800 [Gemmataceae bacterium]